MPDKQMDDDFELLDRASREKWATAAGIVTASLPKVVILKMARRGEHEFIRIARPILHGHMFKHDDFRRIFHVVKLTAEFMKKHGFRPNPRKIVRLVND